MAKLNNCAVLAILLICSVNQLVNSTNIKCLRKRRDAPVVINQITSTEINNPTDYFAIRQDFLNNETSRRLGYEIVLNANEEKVNKILFDLKQAEINEGFENPIEFIASRHIFEVMNRIKDSKVFQIIQRMPKGAVLHAHDTAMASVDFVVETVLMDPRYTDIIWFCDNVTANQVKFKFSIKTPEKLDGFSDWRILHVERAKYPEGEFNKMVRKHFLMNSENPWAEFKDINDVWIKFLNIFGTLDPIVLYKPVWQDYFYRALEEFYADNVQYLEFRGLLPELYDLNGTKYTKMDTIAIYSDTLKEFKSKHPDFIGAKFIFAPFRKVDNQTFEEYMELVKVLKASYPHLVAGFDLVAQEDKGNPLKDYIEPLLDLHATNPDIDFFFHAGETNWNGMDTDENLIDAVLLNTKRIGHGYSILKHPKVMEEVKRRGIAIEVNPISNQVLKLVDDNRNHPCTHLFADNFPVVISSDDPSFWEAKPLSHDFYIAFMGIASAHSDLKLLKKLAMNSLQYSSFRGNEYSEAYGKWETKWNSFVDDILKDYQ